MADPPNPFDQKVIGLMLADSRALFVGHVPAREVTTGVYQRVEQVSKAAGRQKELIRTISDSNGRPVFEIYRFGCAFLSQARVQDPQKGAAACP